MSYVDTGALCFINEGGLSGFVLVEVVASHLKGNVVFKLIVQKYKVVYILFGSTYLAE